jgi:hypothetical protein
LMVFNVNATFNTIQLYRGGQFNAISTENTQISESYRWDSLPSLFIINQ